MLFRSGDVDAVMVHSPPQEKMLVSEGTLVCRQPVAYNFFVLIGPRSDAAGTRGLSLAPAFARIFQSANQGNAMFISRGDDSGTHQKERGLWELAGINYSRLVPYSGKWYLESGKGMGDTLLVANEEEAYTLSDIGTWLAFRSRVPNLDLLIDRSLDGINVYSLLLVNAERFPRINLRVASLFEEYVSGDEGQRRIENLGLQEFGQPLFQPFDGLRKGQSEPVADWIFQNAVFETPCPSALPPVRSSALLPSTILQGSSLTEEVLAIVGRSLYVSVSATTLATLWSVPASLLLAFGRFRLREAVVIAFETLMSVPTVVIGLLFFLLLSRSGPLGSLDLLYTNEGMIIASGVLVTPILVSLFTATLRSVGKEVRESVLTLGGKGWKAGLEVLHDARVSISVSVLVAFTRAIGELGVAFMVGGDIRFKTRLLSTAVAFETARGNWEIALALSLSLLLLVSGLTVAYLRVVKHGSRR